MHEYNYSCLLTIYKNVYMTNRVPVVLQSYIVIRDGILVCMYQYMYMPQRSRLTGSTLQGQEEATCTLL